MSRLAAPVAEASPRPARGAPLPHQRVALLDVTRGLLFLLMTHAHALTVAQVSAESVWRSAYWLPQGWATSGFILLAGYTLGFLVPWQGHHARTRTTLRRRSRDLLAVMFVSNVVFLALQHVADGTPYVLLQWRWWLGLLTLDTPYSISAILLPTGLLLWLAPALFALEDAHPRLFPGVVLLVTLGVAWSQVQTAALPQPRLLALLLHGERLGVPVFLLLAYGCLGLAAGRLSRRCPTQRVWLAGLGGSGFLLLRLLYRVAPHSAVTHVLGASLLPPTQLAVVMSVAWLLVHMRWPPLTTGFQLLGGDALFAFVVHRLLLQSIAGGLHVLAVADAGARYGLLVTSTMVLTWGLCGWRQRQAAARQGLLRDKARGRDQEVRTPALHVS